MRRLAYAVFGKMQPIASDARGECGIAGNQETKAACAGDSVQTLRQFRADARIGVAQDDGRALWQCARRGKRIGQPLFICHQDQRR